MGCLFSRFSGSEPLTESPKIQPKQYSWDKREKLNVQDFIIENVKDETVGRKPGTVNGQQFIIRNCENCDIYIFDHIATVTVDDCINCRIFLGPIRTSVFIRDCKQCKFVVACQQFRTRDCQKMDVFLCCVTQPIIESSTGVRLGCFQYFYPELESQFRSAGLSIFNNSWSIVHDFTPVPGENNYNLLPLEAKVEDYVPIPTTEQFSEMQIDLDPTKSVIPQSLGPKRKTSDECCLIVFFNDGGSHDRALAFIEAVRALQVDCDLIQTKEVDMGPEDSQRVFGSESYDLVVRQGPVIGLEYSGKDCIKHCQECVVNLTTGTTGLVFVSQSPALATQQVENFYNFAEMQMAV
ncbi:protein XRP2-like [Liolophura sinensis]|uniref:protein XRP2-like n=1 Tax=Liolophura sinensis TaxID=3198878 RepID=UPI0031581465